MIMMLTLRDALRVEQHGIQILTSLPGRSKSFMSSAFFGKVERVKFVSGGGAGGVECSKRRKYYTPNIICSLELLNIMIIYLKKI